MSGSSHSFRRPPPTFVPGPTREVAVIELPCPRCGREMISENARAGKRASCPSCGHEIRLAPASAGGPAHAPTSELTALPRTPPPVGCAAETATLPPRRVAAASANAADAETVTRAAPPEGDGTATVPPSGAAQASAPRLALVPGYEILGGWGRGGMGVVYRARQTKLDRLVALKMVLSGAHAGADALARFRTEAEAVARLQHPNVVQIHEVGEHDGLPYFSLEFCGG